MSLFSPARKERADLYLPAQRQILSKYFHYSPDAICEADLQTDFSGTDLILPNGTKVAVRVRSRWFGDVAFRYSTDRVRTQEWEKIVDGTAAPYYLYCVGSGASGIELWWLLDTTVIQDAHNRGWSWATSPDENINGDGMMTVKLDGFPERYGNRPFVLASSASLALAA